MYDALRELWERRGAAAPGGLVVGGPEATFARLPAADPSAPAVAVPPPAPRVRRWPGLLAVGVAGAVLGAGLTLGGLALAPDRTGTASPVVASTASQPASTTPSGSASPATPAAEAPPIGGCWGGILVATGRVSAEPLDCGKPHRWETYANGQLAETTTSPLRSAVTNDPVVQATCTRARLRDYLTGARGEFRTEVIPPTELQYAGGERGFACVATVESGAEQTGSLRDR